MPSALVRRAGGLGLIFAWLACDETSTAVVSPYRGTWDLVPGQVFARGTGRDSMVSGVLIVADDTYDGFVRHHPIQGSTILPLDSAHVSGPNYAGVGTGCGEDYPPGSLLMNAEGDTALAYVGSFSNDGMKFVRRHGS